MLKQFEEQLVFVEMNLSEIVRSGAQMMLQYALEREVTEALGRNYYENAPATTKEKGRRNGYESHRVLTGEGAVTVQVPRVRETEKVFQSKILDAYVSRTEKLDELIARMYVHGMSTRDIEATFADVLSGTGVSKSVVSRVTRCLSEDFEAFRKRDLSNEELLYLELDGTYLRYQVLLATLLEASREDLCDRFEHSRIPVRHDEQRLPHSSGHHLLQKPLPVLVGFSVADTDMKKNSRPISAIAGSNEDGLFPLRSLVASRTSCARLRRKCATNSRQPSLSRSMRTATSKG